MVALKEKETQTEGQINRSAIMAMIVCVFGLGSAEYAAVGVLPEIAQELQLSIPITGLVVTVYAVSVAVTGPILTTATLGVTKKRLMLSVMSLFVVGNAICAMAPVYAVLLAGRAISAVALSTFVAASISMVASMVPSERLASAISWVASGLIFAMLVGAPLGTAVGQQVGWRATFWGLVLVGVIGIVMVTVSVPDYAAVALPNTRRYEIRRCARPSVFAALGVAVIGQSGLFATYTYMPSILMEVTGFTYSSVSILLVVFGVGGLAGNVLGGRLADRSQVGATIGLLATLAVVLAGFSTASPFAVATVIGVVLLGAVGFSLGPVYQAWVHRLAGGSSVAVATNTSGINAGIAIGAWVGGRALDKGVSLANLGWLGAVVAIMAMIGACAMYAMETPHTDRQVEAK